MKRSIITSCLALWSLAGTAAIIKWDGQAGNDQWNSALNWDTDAVPGIADEVILDNTYITGDYFVFLPPGSAQVSLISLVIKPVSGASIQCILPVTSTASPALLLTAPGDAFVLHEGAVFRNASGAAAGTPVTVTANGYFRINDGGHYIHQTARGHTDFLVSRLSTEAGTELGIFEFDVPGTASYTISVSGRTFGRLVFSANSAGMARTYTGAGINPVLVRGGLQIGTNTTFSYGANTDTITIRGSSLIQPGGVFNISNGSNNAMVCFTGDLNNQGLITESGSSAASALMIGGEDVQSVSCTGMITQQVSVIMNNGAGMNLLTPLLLPYGLQFIRGKIYSTSVNILSLSEAAFCTGASELGFVQGPVRKSGNTAFVFPVGTGGIYAPVSLGAGGLLSDVFTAEYRRSNPQSVPGLGSSCAYPINHISYVEYWNLLRLNGSLPRQVGLSASPASFVYNLEALVVARSDGGQWVSEGGADHVAGTPMPPYVTGAFVSLADVEEFGAFTIGSLINQVQNPLPLPIEYFNAETANGLVQLKWRTGICPAENIRSELEYAPPGGDFIRLYSSWGNGTTCDHAYMHLLPSPGQSRYRLTLFGESGDTLASKTVAVIVAQDIPDHHSLLVRAGNNGIEAIARLPRGKAEFLIVDAAGRVVFSRNYYVSGQREMISFPVYLLKGVYRLIAVCGRNKFVAAFIQ